MSWTNNASPRILLAVISQISQEVIYYQQQSKSVQKHAIDEQNNFKKLNLFSNTRYHIRDKNLTRRPATTGKIYAVPFL